MEIIERKQIDWLATGARLEELRRTNAHLRRYVCWYHRREAGVCELLCDACRHVDRLISRAELADVFGTSEDVISNWETGRTDVPTEDLLHYGAICRLPLSDVAVFL
jgi:transcriptional regulator with XRE-family HTH domain